MMYVKIDTKEYVSNLKHLIDDGQEVVITVAGGSMEPFLRNGRDRVLLKKPTELLKRGDIVFYQRKNGQFVLHRIFKARREGYYMMGDRQIELEGPIDEAAVFAIVTEVERSGHWISSDAFLWKFFCGMWRILYPARKLAYWLRRAIRK